MLPINWLFVNAYDGTSSGFKTLVKALARAPHESLFSTDLVVTLVESFWTEYSTRVISLAFIPFMVYLLVTVRYFATYMNDEPKNFDLMSSET